MPSNVVTADTTAQVVAKAVKNAWHKVTSMTIDNINGSGDHTVRVQDEFTPDISAGVASPVLTDVDRWKSIVAAGERLVLDERDMKGVRCLGNLQIIAEAIDANCIISVGYEDE